MLESGISVLQLAAAALLSKFWVIFTLFGSRPVDRGAVPVRMFSSSASNTRLSANNNLSGDGKKASRSSDLIYASDLLDLNPLFSNCVERRSSFRPGDRDFNHE